jgi:hypothetical protein
MTPRTAMIWGMLSSGVTDLTSASLQVKAAMASDMNSAPREFSDHAICEIPPVTGLLKQRLTRRQPDCLPGGTLLGSDGEIPISDTV